MHLWRFCKVLPEAETTGFFHHYIPWTPLPHTLKSYLGFPFLSFYQLHCGSEGWVSLKGRFSKGSTEITGLFTAGLLPLTSKCKHNRTKHKIKSLLTSFLLTLHACDQGRNYGRYYGKVLPSYFSMWQRVSEQRHFFCAYLLHGLKVRDLLNDPCLRSI